MHQGESIMSRPTNRMTSGADRREDDLEVNDASGMERALSNNNNNKRRRMKIQPATVFCVLVSGVLVFVISMTVRTQSRRVSTTSGSSFASGIDGDASLQTMGEMPTAGPTDIAADDTAADNVEPETVETNNDDSPDSKAAVDLLIDKIESLIDQLSASTSRLQSNSPSAPVTDNLPSASPSSIPSDASTSSDEPSTTYSQIPSIVQSTNSSNPTTSSLSNSPSDGSTQQISTTLANSTAIPSPTAAPESNTLSPSSSSTNDNGNSTNITFTPFPTLQQPTSSPSQQSTNTTTSSCFTSSIYDSIDTDISNIKQSISNNIERSHFLGGIVRLTAHDFMDYDRNALNTYGSDGCIDTTHQANAGLPQSVWCTTCSMRVLYETKYSFLSRADYWIAAAQAVIRQTSVNHTLDLKEEFKWGRIDRDTCDGSGERLPIPSGCREVEDTFLDRMGLEWRDAVALMGAHSLGRGNASFSGHEGVWVNNADDAQVFDKKYYEAIYLNAWRPRIFGEEGQQDWTTGSENSDDSNPRMMLNTDLCLVYDIESTRNQCCTRTNLYNDNGDNACLSSVLSNRRCPYYSRFSSRREAVDAVDEFLGGEYPNDNNEPFYEAFREAWVKATTLGWDGLEPLAERCDG